MKAEEQAKIFVYSPILIDKYKPCFILRIEASRVPERKVVSAENRGGVSVKGIERNARWRMKRR